MPLTKYRWPCLNMAPVHTLFLLETSDLGIIYEAREEEGVVHVHHIDHTRMDWHDRLQGNST